MHAAAQEQVFSDRGIDKNSIVVVYTNDVHGGASSDEEYSGSGKSLGFAAVSAIKEEAESAAAGVTLVDTGDAIQGSILCSESEGEDLIQIMNRVGYDFQIVGNHEFDYGAERLHELIGMAHAQYLAANYIDLTTGKSMLEPYKIVSYQVGGNSIRVAYLGIMTPENISKGSISDFQDAAGNYIYGFEGERLDSFYHRIQEGIDKAYADGADCVVALGHLGDEGITEGWSSADVIENTKGITAFLDGHAHSVVPQAVYKDLEGNSVFYLRQERSWRISGFWSCVQTIMGRWQQKQV